jgi:hypothetical protein
MNTLLNSSAFAGSLDAIECEDCDARTFGAAEDATADGWTGPLEFVNGRFWMRCPNCPPVRTCFRCGWEEQQDERETYCRPYSVTHVYDEAEWRAINTCSGCGCVRGSGDGDCHETFSHGMGSLNPPSAKCLATGKWCA